MTTIATWQQCLQGIVTLILTMLHCLLMSFISSQNTRSQINSVGDTETHHCGRTSLIRKLVKGFLTHLLQNRLMYSLEVSMQSHGLCVRISEFLWLPSNFFCANDYISKV